MASKPGRSESLVAEFVTAVADAGLAERASSAWVNGMASGRSAIELELDGWAVGRMVERGDGRLEFVTVRGESYAIGDEPGDGGKVLYELFGC